MKNAKRILSFILTIVMILNMNVFVFAAQDTAKSQSALDADELSETISAELKNSETNIPGDMNGDGNLNSADAIYLLRHTIMPSMYPIPAQGDVNGDGILNSADAIYLLRHTIMPDRYPIASQESKNEYEEGFDVYDLTVDTEGNTISAQVSALNACKLLVRFIDEDIYFAPEYPENKAYIDDGELYAETMIAAAENAIVSAEIIGTLPKKFVAEAVLVDENNENLSRPFVILTHSEKYEAFQNVTVDDFDEDDIVIEYDDGSNNLVVLADDVKSLTAASVVVEYSDDYSSVSYRIKNPSDNINIGEKIFITSPNLAEGAFFKVDSITIEQGIFIITPVSMDDISYNIGDMYQFIRFSADQGATFSQKDDSVDEAPSYYQETIHFPFQPIEIEEGVASGSLNFNVDVNLKLQFLYDPINLGLRYLEYMIITDTTATATLTMEAEKGSENILGRRFGCALAVPVGVPGLFVIAEMVPTLSWSLSGGFTAVATYRHNVGVFYRTNDGLRKTDPVSTAYAELKEVHGEASVTLGPEISIGISYGIPSKDIGMGIGLTAFVGVRVRGELAGQGFKPEEEEHLCQACVDGMIEAVWNFSTYANISLTEEFEVELPKWKSPEFTKELSKFYAHISGPWEISNKKIGLGECPNRKSPGLAYSINEDNVTCTVTGIGIFEGTELNIPSTLYGSRVTSIGEWAFYDCSSLQSITIPDSVTNIGKHAFGCCTSLQSITIPDSVTSIGESAFSGCSSLQSITIPNSVTSIGEWAFRECSSLQSITIPNSVTNIGEYAFCDCSSLQSITIPNSVTSIGEYAFYGCSSLQSITIPDSVTSIGIYAFFDCISLQSVKIGNSVTSIGEKTFRGCSSLRSIKIPDSVTSIGEDAFHGCSNLRSATIGNQVKIIGDWAFRNCSSLQSITIPNSVTSIGEDAFYGCSNLRSATIGNQVKIIGDWAFGWCTNLTSIEIPNSVTSIGVDAFHNCSSLQSVKIGNSVTSIGVGAFSYCASLTNVSMSDWQESLFWNRFYGTPIYDNYYADKYLKQE